MELKDQMKVVMDLAGHVLLLAIVTYTTYSIVIGAPVEGSFDGFVRTAVRIFGCLVMINWSIRAFLYVKGKVS